ncbi:MAG: hypothetical protein LBE31_03105 [Deltaproteobacteria bacterium]|nr:hypothetical protein [Deltaproteobacteria bacterium]
MSSAINEEMVFVARDCQSILDMCDKIADAGGRLTQQDQTRLLDSLQIASSLSAKDRESQVYLAARLMNTPILARVVCKDETNRTRIFYTTPVSPPAIARANLSSIYSSFGRLTVLPLGASFVTFKGETLVLTERAILRTSDYSLSRDIFNTLFAAVNRDVVRVKSLRAFQEAFGDRRRKKTDSDLEESLVPPEALDVVVDEGETRLVSSTLSLNQPIILDIVQDEICRRPQSFKTVILGPPGVGKTTTLIRRLDFRIAKEAIEEEEAGSYERLDNLTEVPHAASWTLFTPTSALRRYVKESFAKFFIPGFQRGARTWEEARLELASEHFQLIGPGGLNLVSQGEGKLSPAATADAIGWYNDFFAFHLKSFYRTLRLQANRLALLEDHEISSLGQTLVGLLDKAVSKPLGWFRQSLAPYQESIGELLEANNARFRQEIKSAFQKQTSDPDFIRGLISLSSKLTVAEDSSDRYRSIAYRLYGQAVGDQALAIYKNRTLPKDSMSGKVAAWLGEGRMMTETTLKDLGFDRSISLALKRFRTDSKVFLNSFFGSILPNYLIFKRSNQLWYQHGAAAPDRVEGLEVDLLLLTFLETGSELIKAEHINPGSVAYNRPLSHHQWLLRNQILIDEASDFTPVQIKCMAALAHPNHGSVTIAADLTLGFNPHGLTTIEQIDWALPKNHLVELSVNYRQSRQLADLSDALSGTSKGRFTSHYFNNPGPKPALAVKVGSLNDIALWLSDRIAEIRERTSDLPSIGVIVSDRDTTLLAEALTKALAPVKIKAVTAGIDLPPGRPGEISVLNFNQIRGLEFEAVFVVDRGAVPGRSVLNTKTLYLAASRAVTYLGLCFGGDIPRDLENLKAYSAPDWAQPMVPLETLSL